MKISEEYFNQLNPSYQTVIKELEQTLDDNVDDVNKQMEAMMEFSWNYLMPKVYWNIVMSYSPQFVDEDLVDICVGKAYYHFYYDIERNYLDDIKNDTYKFRKTLKFAFIVDYDFINSNYKTKNSDLSFPHSHLNKVYYEIESKSHKPLPQELIAVYEINKSFYKKIRAAKEDVEEWFKLLCEAADANEDREIVTHNVEYRLGSNLMDKKLWKLYIEYLQEHDPDEMLEVYSKYCRFFLDDAEMKEKYKQEVDTYGRAYVPWKNLFDFELSYDELSNSEDDELDETGESEESDSDENADETSDTAGPSAAKRLRLSPTSCEQSNDINDEAPETFPKAEEPDADKHRNESEDNDDQSKTSEGEKQNQLKSLCKKFYNEFQLQNFPFKNPIISYILKTANHEVLKKLHQSCKYFFHRKQMPICRRLVCTSHENKKPQFREESLELTCLNNCDINELLNNTHITTSFEGHLFKFDILSKIPPRLSRCDVKYIDIGCNLSADQLKFLIQSGNVVVFKWRNLFSNTQRLEEITRYLPKIEELDVRRVEITSQTFSTILNQTFVSKIYSLSLCLIKGDPFNIDDFLEYCNRNCAEYFYLHMIFNIFLRETFCPQLYEELKNYVKSRKHTTFRIK